MKKYHAEEVRERNRLNRNNLNQKQFNLVAQCLAILFSRRDIHDRNGSNSFKKSTGYDNWRMKLETIFTSDLITMMAISLRTVCSRQVTRRSKSETNSGAGILGHRLY